MDFKWTSESIVACAALAVSLGGGISATAVHYGVVNGDVATLQTEVAAHEIKIEAARNAITDVAVHSAKIEQSLSDVKDSLDRIEKKQDKLTNEVIHGRR